MRLSSKNPPRHTGISMVTPDAAVFDQDFYGCLFHDTRHWRLLHQSRIAIKNTSETHNYE